MLILSPGVSSSSLNFAKSLTLFYYVVVIGWCSEKGVEMLFERLSFELGYRSWKSRGGLRQALNVKDDLEIWGKIATFAPKALSVESEVSCIADAKTVEGENENHRFIVPTDRLTIWTPGESATSSNIPSHAFPVACRFVKVFPVKTQELHFGCHTRFPILKAFYAMHRYGGDPACGGGMKYHFAPTHIERREREKLLVQIKEKRFTAFVEVNTDGRCASAYMDESNSWRGNLVLYLGDEAHVREYLTFEREESVNIKKIEVTRS